MNSEAEYRTKVFARITDTIFAVLMSLSFVQYHWLLAPPQISLKLAMLFLAYVLIVSSRIGFHLSIRKKPYYNNRRFLVDFGILFSYFVLLAAPGFDQDSMPNILLMLGSLVSIFSGYLLWDFFKKQEHKEKFSKAILISIICLLISVSLFSIYYFIPFEIVFPNIPSYIDRDLIFVIASLANIIIFWHPKMKLLFGND